MMYSKGNENTAQAPRHAVTAPALPRKPTKRSERPGLTQTRRRGVLPAHLPMGEGGGQIAVGVGLGE
jgi:hypothetical protein